ncbi:MAG: hypothetical protein ACYCTL_08460 [Acidimicrobiales bacterium]
MFCATLAHRPGPLGVLGRLGAPGNDGALGRLGVLGRLGALGNDGALGRLGALGNDGMPGRLLVRLVSEGSPGRPEPLGNPGRLGVLGRLGTPGNDGALGRLLVRLVSEGSGEAAKAGPAMLAPANAATLLAPSINFFLVIRMIRISSFVGPLWHRSPCGRRQAAELPHVRTPRHRSGRHIGTAGGHPSVLPDILRLHVARYGSPVLVSLATPAQYRGLYWPECPPASMS